MESFINDVIENLWTKLASLISLLFWVYGVIKWFVLKLNFTYRTALLIAVLWGSQGLLIMSIDLFEKWSFSSESYPISTGISYGIPFSFGVLWSVFYSFLTVLVYWLIVLALKYLLSKIGRTIKSFERQKKIVSLISNVSVKTIGLTLLFFFFISAVSLFVHWIESMI